MKKVQVAIFIYRGVLNDLEVFAEPGPAQAKADEWKKEANPEEDVVDVLEKEVTMVGTPIKELGLTRRYHRRLWFEHIRTVEQLCQMSESDLLLENRIGVICIAEVRKALARRGLSLADG